MAIWQIDIQKVSGGIYWTNVYHIDAPTIGDAQSAGFTLVDKEKIIHQTNCSFNKMRVSQYPVPSGQFIVTPLSGPGLAPSVSNIPLFVVARVEFGPTVGRPGVKMYKCCLTEDDIVGQNGIATATVTFYTGWANDLIDDVPGLCKPNGTTFVTGKLLPVVGMRQLRRGSKKKTTPVI